MDNLFNDQVVPVTNYDIKKFKKDYSINYCVTGEDLTYHPDKNIYFTTKSDIMVKRHNTYFSATARNPGDLSWDNKKNSFSGCYIHGYENTDNRFLTSKLLQQNIDNKKLEISQSNFTGYYHRITFTGKPLKDKEMLEQRFYTGIDDGHRPDTQDKYYNDDDDRVGYYPVFHTDDILELRKKPSEKFIKYFFYSLFTTILLAVIACCTEFWLIYSGDHTKRSGKDREISIVIENSCTNIGKKHDNSNEKSYNCDILEQVFRWRIWNYPYQKCNDTIIESTTAATSEPPPSTADPAATGGAKSRYDYHYNITEEPPENIKTDKGKLSKENHIDECKVEGAKTDFGHRPFPYNIGEKADQLFNSELSRIIPRNVGYVILFIMLMYRYLVYHMFKNISNFYNESLKGLPIIKIIIFFVSPILISLFINIVPILSTIGVLFFILFMIVQILQLFTDISNSDSKSPKMQSKEAFLVIIIFTILCYIVSIIISEIAFTSSYNTAKGERCNSVGDDEILQELKRIEYRKRFQMNNGNIDKKEHLKAKYNLEKFKEKQATEAAAVATVAETVVDNAKNNAQASLNVLITDYSENENSLIAMADQAIENIRNSKCLSKAEFNNNFKTCQTYIDRYFSINHNIFRGISGDLSVNDGKISGTEIDVKDYLVSIVSDYIAKVKSDKNALTVICYILIGCLGIFGIGTVGQKMLNSKF